MATRKQRGLQERIYLLDAKLDSDQWILTVKGQSKSVYKIILCSIWNQYTNDDIFKKII